MPSAVFLVIAFTEAILVMVPSIVFFALGWRCGFPGRVFSVFALLLLVVLSWSACTDPEFPDFESRVLVLFAVWGAILYFGVGVFLCAKVVSGFFRRLHA